MKSKISKVLRKKHKTNLMKTRPNQINLHPITIKNKRHQSSDEPNFTFQ